MEDELQPAVAFAGRLVEALSLPLLEALADSHSLQKQSPELLEEVQSARRAHATQPHHTRGLQQLMPGTGSLFGAGTMLSSGQALRSQVSLRCRRKQPSQATTMLSSCQVRSWSVSLCLWVCHGCLVWAGTDCHSCQAMPCNVHNC